MNSKGGTDIGEQFTNLHVADTGEVEGTKKNNADNQGKS